MSEKLDEWPIPGRGGGAIVLPYAPVDRVILFRNSKDSKDLDRKLRLVFGVLLPTTRRWYSRELGLEWGSRSPEAGVPPPWSSPEAGVPPPGAPGVAALFYWGLVLAKVRELGAGWAPPRR
jgi:hypothetical protein